MELLRRLSLAIFLIILSGCGGGSLGEDDAEPVPEPITVTLSLAISDPSVSEQSPATITATVLDDGVAVSGKLVTFTLDNDQLVFFTPEAGTAITDSNGEAVIVINAGEVAGAGSVTATISDEIDPVVITFNSLGDGNTGTEPNVADIGLFASSQQMSSSGSIGITLTAVIKDVNNNLVEDVSVTFSADSGEVEIVSALTGPDGKATALLKTDNNPQNRVILATVSTGTGITAITDSVNIQVVGTTVSLSGSSSLAIDDNNTYILKVLNSEGIGIANTVVELSLSGESTTTPVGDVADIDIPNSVTTDFTGQATVVVKGTSGGTNSIIAKTLGAATSLNVAVQADSFLFTNFNDGNGNAINPRDDAIPDVLLSKEASLTLEWERSGVPMPDGTLVEFTTTRGVLTTNSGVIVNGEVSAFLGSDNAGTALVTFTGTDGNIILNNQLEFEFIAETVETITAQASPKSIGPNGQTSTISVVVKDVKGNLVKNKLIDFTLSDTSGGSIFPASAVTDSSGSASTVYTSNGISAQNGVAIKATVREDETKNDLVTLTVSNRELFIAIGTGNELIELDTTTYNKQYTVFVTDVDSNPVENSTLTVSAIPKDYYKGAWYKGYDATGSFVSWYAGGETEIDPKYNCANEDINLDGILDVGEDTNNNGMLTPGNVVAASREVTTDSQGRAIIDILYPQSFGSWVDITLILSARVNGTESSTQTIFTLPTLSTDVLDEDVSPPTAAIGLNSPFGRLGSCIIAD